MPGCGLAARTLSSPRGAQVASPVSTMGSFGLSVVVALPGPQHLILSYVGLFARGLSPLPELHAVARLSSGMAIAVQQLLLRRRNTLLAEQMMKFPTIVDDILAWGWPSSLWPLPQWKRWRVDVWWNYDDDTRHDHGWHIEETMWFSRLPDLKRVFSRVFTAAGLYAHRRFELSSWVWDYGEPWWQEQNHV